MKVQRTLMSFKCLFWALEEAGGSGLLFGIYISIWIWSLVFDTPMLQIVDVYLDFEDVQNIHVLWVLTLGLQGCWRFQTGVMDLYFNLYLLTGLWYTYNPNIGSVAYFFSPVLRLLRLLKVPVWGHLPWSWFIKSHYAESNMLKVFICLSQVSAQISAQLSSEN